MVTNIVAVFPLNLKTKTNFPTDNVLFFSCFLPHRSDRRADENGPTKARRNPARRRPSGQAKKRLHSSPPKWKIKNGILSQFVV